MFWLRKVLVFWTWNYHVLSIYWLSTGDFVPSVSRSCAPLKFRGPNSPPVPAPTSGSPALQSQPLPSPSLRMISTPFASLALFRHSLYWPSLFVNGLRSSLSALSLFDSVRSRPLRAVSTSSIFAALLSSPSSLSSVTISPFWPCFWPSSFFFSHQVHALLKVTLQENNKNIT
jgi:hypothetical protein